MARCGRSHHIENAVAEPVWRGIEFSFDNTADFGRYLAGDPSKGRYGRYDNRSWRIVESRIAQLERCDEALLFASGMAALTAVALCFLHSGDAVAYCLHSYRNVAVLFEDVLSPMGIKPIVLDHADEERFDWQLRQVATEASLRALYIELPSNPHLFMGDIELMRNRLGSDRLLVVDSTLATPLHFKPCDVGADLAVHSCGKYLGGHGDLMAGAVAGSRSLIARLRRIRDITGPIPDGETAFLLNRSLDTLDVRMRHYSETAGAVAKYLAGRSWTKRVFYTGLESHPHAGLIKRYLRGHGGVVTFELDADKTSTGAFVDALRLPYMASNFGSTRALVEQLSTFSYYMLTAADRKSLDITDSMIRLSIGMETAEELMADLDRAAATTMA
jgi:cystathionine gamma-synthase